MSLPSTLREHTRISIIEEEITNECPHLEAGSQADGPLLVPNQEVFVRRSLLNYRLNTLRTRVIATIPFSTHHNHVVNLPQIVATISIQWPLSGRASIYPTSGADVSLRAASLDDA
jgi:hypothetical protein